MSNFKTTFGNLLPLFKITIPKLSNDDTIHIWDFVQGK